MARGKKAKNGGKSKVKPRSKALNNKIEFASSSRARSSPINYDISTFTLRDAARTSEHPRDFWSASSLSLRHRSMHFVPSNEPFSSEGDSKSSLYEPTNARASAESGHDATIDPTVVLQSRPLEKATGMFPQHDEITERSMSEEQLQQLEEAVACNSPTSSVSSDEVVFVGRNNHRRPPEYGTLPAAGMLPDQPQTPRVLSRSPLYNITKKEVGNSETRNLPGSTSENEDYRASILANNKNAALEDIYTPRNVERQRHLRRRTEQTNRRTMCGGSSDNDIAKEIFDDYVANMLASGEIEAAAKSNAVEYPDGNEKSRWTASDLEDFDNMSTSEDDVGTVQQILSKRSRSGKLQYLVVGESRTADDAKWIPKSALTMPSAAGLIEIFEDKERHVYTHPKSSSDPYEDDPETRWTSDGESDIQEDEEDSFEDEKDIIERRMARMTDEHIAKLFQKQDYLGLDSEELQIFDGIEDFEPSEDAIDDRSHILSRKKRDQKRRKHQRDAYFDMEEDFIMEGDDYGDFDVMDHDRPSLNRSKGPHSDAKLLDISDSALAQDLRDVWAADRRKKSLKKQEREELRAQGLLGRRNKARPDLKTKYDGGMSLTDIEEELEIFLSNGQQDSLCLPPMAKQERKVIHEISNAFGLKSKSQGSNKKRFPILYKTSRTVEFEDMIFGQLRSQLRRRFLPRPDQKGKGNNPRTRKGGASGRVSGDAGYRDGEIVGAAAPELSAENRGRAMLEKMGWSTGTALGALDNQGILTPIEHIVKNSRAGLG